LFTESYKYECTAGGQEMAVIWSVLPLLAHERGTLYQPN